MFSISFCAPVYTLRYQVGATAEVTGGRSHAKICSSAWRWLLWKNYCLLLKERTNVTRKRKLSMFLFPCCFHIEPTAVSVDTNEIEPQDGYELSASSHAIQTTHKQNGVLSPSGTIKNASPTPLRHYSVTRHSERYFERKARAGGIFSLVAFVNNSRKSSG